MATACVSSAMVLTKAGEGSWTALRWPAAARSHGTSAPTATSQRRKLPSVTMRPSISSAVVPAATTARIRCIATHVKEVEESKGSSESQKANCSFVVISKSSSLEMKKMAQEKIEMFESLQGWAEENVLPCLKLVEKSWQPQDLLPESANGEAFEEEVRELRQRCRELPLEYLVCLVGDMITEEALPTYQSLLNSLDGVRDKTGDSPSAWARWIRAWTAEENRHGDLLHKYLYLSGRIDMRSVQKTIHYLIAAGMDPKFESNPYLAFIYTSFQERATFIAHGNTARQAKQFGDSKLAQICGVIASDEKRHENAYQKIVEKLFELDPNGTMLCLEDMLRKRVSMPARLMYDGCDENLYDNFSLVTQRTGIYTTRDYANILEYLIQRWNVHKLSGLSSRGQEAQDYVCNLVARVRRVEERNQRQLHKDPRTIKASFSWIFNNEVDLV